MSDEKFANAGKAAGLQIWRVENFDLKPVAENDFGKFYVGDSYLVLSTKKCGGLLGMGSFSWDIHFWQGQETSQDEAGAVAVFSVELDDYLGGGPIEHREVQGHETDLFLSYFKSGIRYLPGGVATGFKHFDPNNWENCLYQVKGKRNVRVKKVEAHISAMNRGDCFILDANHDIYVYVGRGAKRMERIRAISAANMIRDQDHGGRSRVHIVDEFSDQGEVDTFFERLGSGSADEVADESSGGEDEEFEIKEQEDISLFKVWEDPSGRVTVSKVGQYPLRHAQLDSNVSGDCFVLDAGTAGLFVWIGRNSTKNEKVQAMNKAQVFLKEHKRPWWSKISRVVEGAEPAAFKQYFVDWRDQSILPSALNHVYSPNRLNAVMEEAVELPADDLRRLVKQQGPAVGFMPDQGAGHVEVWRIEDFELQPVPKETYGRFFGGDSYVVKYTGTAGGKERHVIYFWQGETSSQDERAAAAMQAVRLDDDLGGRAIQVRVVQGHEPRHFMSIFKGRMIVFLGGHHSGFRNASRDSRDDEHYGVNGARLFRVRGTCTDDVRVHQVPARTENLNSDDAFVLDTAGALFVWFGQESSPAEREAALAAARLVAPGREPQQVREGSEPDELWTALGGPGEYTYAGHHSQHAHMPARLFHCQITLRGKFRVNEVDNYSQEDLAEDDVMVLDSGDEVYVWIGDKSHAKEKELSLKMAEDYLKMSPVHRHRATIIQIKQGEEPAGFTTLFPEWDEEYWQVQPSYDDIKRQISANNPVGLSIDYDDTDY
ncbi:gelsolin, cytoplasmic isoform X2 [Thrips palmi]|uniref:Gelsolin, cytoplasmic isoform X2 n=1 Tax=Thrips palmi TaxID=161013 RepID=A0A6P8YTG3_THRPL|nr:gelsolin, cytoplasmic isoform X2 [Thrips palmi]